MEIAKLPAWAKRALNPDTPMTVAKETVRTMSMDNRLFPTIRMINGKLVKLKPEQAYDMSIERGDFIQFDSEAEATAFSKKLSKMIDRKRSVMSELSGAQ